MSHSTATLPSATRSKFIRTIVVWLVATISIAVTATASAGEQPREDHAKVTVGASLFRAYCATCHGTAAEGDGPLAESLRVTPANLTVLASENDGEFPFERVQMRIDGREKVRGHGPSDMPVWGKAFKQTDEDATDEQVQDKVLALAHYIRSLQTDSDNDS